MTIGAPITKAFLATHGSKLSDVETTVIQERDAAGGNHLRAVGFGLVADPRWEHPLEQFPESHQAGEGPNGGPTENGQAEYNPGQRGFPPSVR